MISLLLVIHTILVAVMVAVFGYCKDPICALKVYGFLWIAVSVVLCVISKFSHRTGEGNV